MKKTYLLAPGPTPIPESVSAALAQPILHHRTPAFQSLFEEVRAGLKYLFQTKQEVILLTASGTGAMEAAVSNLFSRGDQVITLNAGKFGERWTKLAQAYGLRPIELKVESGEVIEPKQVEETVRAHPEAKAILFQASETSTGVQLPTQEICKIAKNAGMLSVCDAITACGVTDLPMDDWGIDVLITGSQKSLMIPPGLAMIALSDRAWTLSESSDLPKFYFNLAKERKALAKNQTAWTPAISLIQGLHASLKMIRDEGLHNVFRRHDLLARATRNGVLALGLEMFPKKSPSGSVTAVKVPSKIKDGKMIPKTMRDKYGVIIAGGQDELEGKIFRLSHIGYCDKFDIAIEFSALELALNDLGYPVEFGIGVGAVLKTYSEGEAL
jgi:aspartate aminotransferase-like enzyme